MDNIMGRRNGKTATSAAVLLAMAGRWRVIPRIRFVDYHKEFPVSKSVKSTWKRALDIQCLWNGKIIHITIKHYAIVFDFRHNWLADMIGGAK